MHPYYGFVCTPGSRIDFSDSVPRHFAHGAIADIDAEGFRNTASRAAEKPTDEFWIGLFGGSAAFSVAASANDTTIAARLEQRLRREGFGGGRRLRVVDFSLPACQQPQQLLICTLNLGNLDGIVTFDGVNEFVVPAFYNVPALRGDFPHRPIYEGLYSRGVPDAQLALAWLRREKLERFGKQPRWRQWLTKRRHDAQLAELTAQLRSDRSEVAFQSLFPRPERDSAQAVAAGVLRWRTSIERMHLLCTAAGIRTLFTVQPIPERDKALTAREMAYLEAQPQVVELRRTGYSAILERCEELARLGIPAVPLSDVFSAERGEIYTDLIHFEDAGCSLVADRLASLILERW